MNNSINQNPPTGGSQKVKNIMYATLAIAAVVLAFWYFQSGDNKTTEKKVEQPTVLDTTTNSNTIPAADTTKRHIEIKPVIPVDQNKDIKPAYPPIKKQDIKKPVVKNSPAKKVVPKKDKKEDRENLDLNNY